MGYLVSGQHVGPVPTPGQHTDEVLRGALGYVDATIDALRQHGAVKWESHEGLTQG